MSFMTIQGAFALLAHVVGNAQQAQISTISNNVANANTSGYSARDTCRLSTILYRWRRRRPWMSAQCSAYPTRALTASNNQAISAQSYSQQMTERAIHLHRRH